jgi:hypothetical protein
MRSIFDTFSIKTVPSNYSWDEGVPDEQTYLNFVTDLSALSSTSTNNEEGLEYVGYAPYMQVSFYSSLYLSAEDVPQNLIGLKREIDFGDYYNTESNVLISTSDQEQVLCHNYLMPGLYTIDYKATEYLLQYRAEFSSFGEDNCWEKYCLDWSWKATETKTLRTWKSTLSGQPYEKKWRQEECDDLTFANKGLYIESVEQKNPYSPISCQWYNYTNGCQTTWEETAFQQSKQTTWLATTGPSINVRAQEQTIWKWIALTSSNKQIDTKLTWNDLSSFSPKNTTWNYTKENCIGTKIPYVVFTEDKKTKKAFIRVLENFPTAYLQVSSLNPTNTSPMAVRLSPKVISGSFPIQKIVWDLGDGSPLLTQVRGQTKLHDPFVFSNLLSADYEDPRNYDIVHTYTRTVSSGATFYPSITAYSSNTNSSDCVAAMVGPIQLPFTNGTEITLLQNELTEHGKISIGQVNDEVIVLRHK